MGGGGGDIASMMEALSDPDKLNAEMAKMMSDPEFANRWGSVLKITDVLIKALVDNISKTEVNDLINENDKRVLIAAKDVNTTPTTKDKVLINNIVHQIITVDTTEAAGIAITFTLIVRS